MIKAIKNTLLIAVCLALIVPAVFMAFGMGRFRIFVVSTGSMFPSITPNSAVIVERGVYKVGQTISFMTANGVVTHRLIERRSDGTLVTKGDANTTADPGYTSPRDVIGGVVVAPPLLGYLLVYLKSPWGVASVAVAMICLWMGGSVAAQYLERRRAAEAEAQTQA